MAVGFEMLTTHGLVPILCRVALVSYPVGLSSQGIWHRFRVKDDIHLKVGRAYALAYIGNLTVARVQKEKEKKWVIEIEAAVVPARCTR